MLLLLLVNIADTPDLAGRRPAFWGGGGQASYPVSVQSNRAVYLRRLECSQGRYARVDEVHTPLKEPISGRLKQWR